MSLNSVVFPDSLPSIDLHGYDRDSARVLTLDFINENYKLKNKFFVIIHGIGEGILKEEVYNTLSKNKYVTEFKTQNFNNGSTIVKINIDM